MTNEEIINLLEKWRSLPDDYLVYLRNSGENVYENGVTVFSNPISAKIFFRDQIQHEGNGNLILIAKDKIGRHFGYNVSFLPYRLEYTEDSNGVCSSHDGIKTFTDLISKEIDNPRNISAIPDEISDKHRFIMLRGIAVFLILFILAVMAYAFR